MMNTGDSERGQQRKGSVRPVRLVTMRQAAAYLAVSYWTIRHWVDAGKLRAIRLPGDGRLLRIELDELDRLVDECREN
jgi:excisionase family DNA binding protein